MRAYLQSRRWALVVIAVCFLVILAVYPLYYAQWAPAGYTVLVLAVILLVAGFFDFRTFRRRMVELDRLLDQTGELTVLPLTMGSPLLDKSLDLTAAVDHRRREERAAQWESQRQDRQYYTLWSHQIKTPLAALELLVQDDPPDRAAMQRELLKLGQYTDMALQYQRLEATENDLVFRRCDLDALVRRTIGRISPLFIGKQVRLELKDLKLEILTDEKWLSLVLEQVLTNAVKYTPSGGQVALYLEPDSVLVIEDDGIGISPQELPRVFEWGYTGTPGRSQHRSTGIGLALCRRAMDLLGSRMDLQSIPGQGTQVRLYLARPELPTE